MRECHGNERNAETVPLFLSFSLLDPPLPPSLSSRMSRSSLGSTASLGLLALIITALLSTLAEASPVDARKSSWFERRAPKKCTETQYLHNNKCVSACPNKYYPKVVEGERASFGDGLASTEHGCHHRFSNLSTHEELPLWSLL